MTDKDDENLGSFYMGRMRKPPEPKRHLPRGTVTILIVLSFVAIIWYAYPRGGEKYTDMDVPVIKADTAEIKVAPVDPGGMEVRHQDSTVFDPLEQKEASGEAETLLPVPEAPLDKAEVIPPPAEEITVPAVVPTVAAPESAVVVAPAPQVAEVKEAIAPVVPPVVETPVAAPAPAVKEQDVKVDEIKKLFDVPAPVAEKPVVEKVEEKKVIAPPKKEIKKVESKKASIPAGGNRFIQLGAFHDASAAQKDWARLKGKYPEYLGKLTMKTEQVYLPGKGVLHRLQAGKLTEARAREVCAFLKTANSSGCILVK